MARSQGDYAAQLIRLLPQGPAWEFAPDGAFARLLSALAAELARVDARILDLVEEADPRTALETLVDWERVTGLPDSCTGAPDNAGERQVALLQKLTGVGGQSIPALKALAEGIGYEVEIEEHRPFRMGARMRDRVNDDAWAHAWTVRVHPPDGLFDFRETLSFFHMGSRMGDRLRGFGALDLECVIGRAAPAHTRMIFAYHIEPEADFWIDLTR
ncbi:putative phage tail protein [Citromicrobium bathyomarinum]|uniref:YmfQ family protein n=1 Tax=Citromicrobium bathyomarinum TaxID=72174 RepID=UPI00315A6730